jgi:uncharacterized membrane protein HdeD (DUF308 family)
MAAPFVTPAEAPRPLRWIPILGGALTALLGALLIFVPGRTVTVFAVLAGIGLCLAGVFDVLWGLRAHAPRAQRVGLVLVGLLSLVTGALVIARPENSVRFVATVVGIYLIVVGVAAVVLGLAGVRRDASVARGVVGVVAGVVLLGWPHIALGVAAVIVGVVFLAIGVAELWFGLKWEPL